MQACKCKKAKPNLGSGYDGSPLCQGGRASLLVGFSADKVALRIEVVVDLAMDRDKFLDTLCPPELEHRQRV
jgi:hypothetical protein